MCCLFTTPLPFASSALRFQSPNIKEVRLQPKYSPMLRPVFVYACYLWWATVTLPQVSEASAGFTKHYPSNTDETVFRLNRSRIRSWQTKCRQQKRSQSLRQAALSSSRRTAASGTRIFLGRPSARSISNRFCVQNRSTPKFNNPNAGELTNPVISATRTVSSFEVDSVAEDAVMTYASVNHVDSESSWWPPAPFLGLNGRVTKKRITAKSLFRDCEVLFKFFSCNFLSRRVLRYQLQVGEGMQCYERVRDFARKWEFDSGDKGIEVVESNPHGSQYSQSFRIHHPLEGTTTSAERSENWGRRMVSWTKVGPFYVLSPIAVIYECVNQNGSGRDGAGTLYTSCAYSTQQGHWLSGEERVTVAIRETKDHFRPPPVEVEILSISRPAPSLMGRLAWPLIGRMQEKFFVEQLRALHQSAAGTTAPDKFNEGQFTNIIGVQQNMELTTECPLVISRR